MPEKRAYRDFDDEVATFARVQAAELTLGGTALACSLIDALIAGQPVRAAIEGFIGLALFGDNIRRSQAFREAQNASK